MTDRIRTISRRRAILWRTVFALTLYAFNLTAVRALQLVTEQEAALPDDLMGLSRGGPTRGPDIDFVAPLREAGLVKSPLTLKIKFTAHGGAKINPESILVTYKKIPAIDITQRLSPFIRANGIEIESVQLPPGSHRFRIDVSDTDGRKATDFLFITVAR